MKFRQPTKVEESEAHYYLDLSEEDLWITVGRAVAGAEGIQYSPRSALKAGREWFDARREQLRKLICEDWGYPKMREDVQMLDRVQLVVILGDVISGKYLGFPVLGIAALLAKMGLDSFCGCGK